MKFPPSLQCPGLIQYLATLSASWAVLTSGINVGWSSPYLPDILAGKNPHISMTGDEGSWCTVMPLVGAPLGAFYVPLVVDRIGRKLTTLSLAPLTVAMFITQAFSRTVLLLCTARFLLGAVEGALYTVLPMYLGEISEPRVRGLLTATISVASAMGILIINVVGFHYTMFVSSLMSISVPLLHFVTFCFMPESPYYLLKRGDKKGALKSLKTLRGKDDVEEELKDIEDSVRSQECNQKSSKFSELFTVPSNRKAMMIFFIINATKKFSGKNPLIFYASVIFHAAGGSLSTESSVLILVSVELLVTIFGIFLVDRVGRRPIVMISAAGCGVALACVGCYFYLKEVHSNLDVTSWFGWLPITALVTFTVFYSFGLDLATAVFLSEMFPTSVKALALSLADTTSVINGTICSKLFYYMAESYGLYLPFFIFSLVCAVGLISIAKYVPETKNKTLEEIQLELKAGCKGHR